MLSVDVEFVFGQKLKICGFFIYPVGEDTCSHAMYPSGIDVITGDPIDVFIGDPQVETLLKDCWKYPQSVGVIHNNMLPSDPDFELRIRFTVDADNVCHLNDCVVYLRALHFRCEKSPEVFQAFFAQGVHWLRNVDDDHLRELYLG
jgi:hypothetical protein